MSTLKYQKGEHYNITGTSGEILWLLQLAEIDFDEAEVAIFDLICVVLCVVWSFSKFIFVFYLFYVDTCSII